jgi:glutaredoxin-like protein NrdH
MAAKHVPGKKVAHIMLYALSTCPWCQKTKRLLDEMGVEYYYEDVDLISGDERRDVISDVERWNPNRSFPTLVINDTRCIIGFQENELRSLLKA